MGTSVFRIRTAVDFPPVLKSDHTMRSCRAASLYAGRPDSFKPGTLTARKFHAHQRPSQTHGGAIQQSGSDRIAQGTHNVKGGRFGRKNRPSGGIIASEFADLAACWQNTGGAAWSGVMVANVMAHRCLK